MLHQLHRAMTLFGVDLTRTTRAVRGLGPYFRNKSELKRQQAGDRDFPVSKLYPCLTDRYEDSGVANGHYFHQDLYVAQRVFDNAPRTHVDVGSRVDGFVAHVAAFRPVEVFDIRPLTSKSRNISFRQADLMAADFPFADYTDSLSCLHTLEHFGLGRYGDPVNYQGYRLGWNNLARMVKPGGRFYFATPIGERQRIEFDAHRVFSVPFLLKMMDEQFNVDRFAYVDDRGDLHTGVDPRSADASRGFGLQYGCGIFELIKR